MNTKRSKTSPKDRGRRAKRARRVRRRAAPAPQTQAIVKVEPVAIVAPAKSAIPTIKETVQNLERVRRFVTSCMNVDLTRALAKLAADNTITPEKKKEQEIALRERLEIDWGTIPGVDKPFLKQPGAEKFMFWLHLKPQYVKREVELGNGHLEIIVSVVMFAKKTSEQVFEGPDCSCTTMESNYRFRFAERDPSDQQPTPEEKDKLKALGLGRNRKKKIWARGKYVGEQWVWQDRVENDNISNERNKVRQIGQKRALVKCVRNMGALSEIFVADPAEWQIPEEDEMGPHVDEDFTAGGRRIVIDGKTPSGKVVEEYHVGGSRPNAAQVAVAQATEREIKESMKNGKAEEPLPKIDGTIEVSYPGRDAQLIHVRGTAVAQIITFLQNDCLGAWLDGAKAWAIPGTHGAILEEFCSQRGIKFSVEKVSGSLTPPAAPPATVAKPGPAAPKGAGVSSTTPTPAPAAAIILAAEETQTKDKKVPVVRVNWGGSWRPCFNKNLWPFLLAGKGLEAELVVDEKNKIIEIKRIGHRQFEENFPCISMGEDRPTSTWELFRR